MSTRISSEDKTMRKVPRQARSRATVDAIVEAGTQVLGRRGWAKFTTNEVAAVAGVSIGSFYQYFPDKLALVGALRKRHFDDVLAVLKSAIGEPAESSIETLVQGMLRIHGANPTLHRALLEEAPRTPAIRKVKEAFEMRYLRDYKTFVSNHLGQPDRGSDTIIMAQVVSAAIEGVVHHAAAEGLLESPALKRELAALVRRYLKARAA